MSSVIADVLLVSPNDLIRPVSIEMGDDGRISQIHSGHTPPAGSEVIFDGGGEVYVTAGFIDIHTHGAMGFDLSYATLEAVETIAEAKLSEGVTTFLPTTWTASREHKIAMAQAAAAYRQNQRFARTPFLHIEGPYLNPAQAGAQDIRYMRRPDVAEIRHLHEICPVGLISLAVEIEGAIPFIREMRQMGIVTSAAHSAATYAEFRAAKEAGLAHLTHYCNQMSGLHHREVGLVGAGLLDDTIMIELICDTVHLCPDMIRLAFKHRSCERLMLITDSIAAAHLGEGRYPLHDGEIIVKDGAARIPAGNLAGSIVTFDESLRNVVKVTGLPLNELARTCSANQARSLGLKDRGSLKQGLLADLTLLTPDLKVAAVYVGGEKRFSA
ncbi:MAG TPA: N-acetylglucosamine-6-phosphate deacetylase [Verrucomicrobiales bacterium]|nr:N-acetylglucosamine-6-phosphate deacetylase [Verrucomicrobiales bacterium]